MRGLEHKPDVALSTRKPENPVILVNVKLVNVIVCLKMCVSLTWYEMHN